MVFSSPLFLFLFLPIVLTLYAMLPGIRARNLCLLIVSLLFYAWGEVGFIFLLLGSTLVNWFLGMRLDREQDPAKRKRAVTLAIVLNIGLLVYFKYTGFALTEIHAAVNTVLSMLHLPDVNMGSIRLPIGISFFTFHALSYVMDIYRRKSTAARNPADTALYIFFFPQLVAGPILRWSGIAPQLVQRVVTRAGFAEGIRRFVGGLAKKVLIANAVALPADQIFKLQDHELTAPLAWFAAVCYMVQIYFDFSGYSDMAVGLGKMFGFQFLENFDYPYISQSVKEFWRRWHISLSSWFRDYLYIPLGGNRCSELRNYLNLVIVFFLCGLWHGASWTFVVWGLYHGIFLVLERTAIGTWIEKMPRILRHGYALLAVLVGWVLFRADSFPQALTFLSNMAGLATSGGIPQPLARFLTHESVLAIIAGAVFATPILPWLKARLALAIGKLPQRASFATTAAGLTFECVIVIALLLVSSMWLAGGTYNPFIYFRF